MSKETSLNEPAKVKAWYNAFSSRQLNIGVNLRHYRLMNELIAGGLRRGSSVLEAGCGVGTLTSLLHSYVSRGKIVSIDISDKSVAIAAERFQGSRRVEFIATDILDFQYNARFDFIILADVLEHIPVEKHKALFGILTNHMHDGTRIFINIPHPQALDYIRKNNPEQLQIIDQSLSADKLTDDICHNDLTLVEYHPYSLFNREHDYVIIWLKKRGEITLHPLPKLCIIRRKLAARISFFLSRL